MISVTMLNSMASSNFEESLDLQLSLGIKWLDLKDDIYGCTIEQLTHSKAKQASEQIQMRGMQVYCLTTSLFKEGIELGEQAYRERHSEQLDHVLAISQYFTPQIIRVLGPRLQEREKVENAAEYLLTEYPWIFPCFKEVAFRVAERGMKLTFENEPEYTIFASPEETLDFFSILNCPNETFFTYDVQNMWQMGTFPTLNAYNLLKPITGYIHVKGGMNDHGSKQLRWLSALADASWPVNEIVEQVIQDGQMSFICINPSHGEVKADYNAQSIVQRDVAFLQELMNRNVEGRR